MTTIFSIGRLMLLMSVVLLTVRGEDSERSSEDEFERDSAYAPKDGGYTSPLDFYRSFEQPKFGLVSAESQSRHNQALAKYQLAGRQNENPSESLYSVEHIDLNQRPRANKGARLQNAPKFEKLVNNPHQFNYQTRHNQHYKVHPQNEGQSILAELRQNPDVAAYFTPPSTKYEIKHPAKYKVYVDEENPEVPNYKSAKLRYLPGVHESNSRIRRYADGRSSRYSRQSAEEDDPYDYRADYASRPKVFDSPAYSGYTDGRKNYEEAEEDPYNYGSDAGYDFKEYERIKSLSEAQAAEIKKNPENCKEEARDGMTCHVCKDPKTGGNFESCSYVSEPKNNKYAYSKEKKFDSHDQPEEAEEDKKPAKYVAEESTESTAEETTPASTKQSYTAPKSTYSPPKYKSTYKSSPTGSYAKLTAADPSKSSYQAYKSDPKEEIEEIPYKGYYGGSSRPKSQSIQASDDEEDDGSEESEEDEPNHKYKPKAYDYKTAIPGFYTDNEQKKDVEHVLAEFKKKDRSSCTKVNKNGMTCYQCIDKSGLKHEECMFISESAPKKSHLAYQESKEFTSKPPTLNDDEGSESKIVATSNPSDSSEEAYGSKLKRKKVASESATSTAPTLIPPMSQLPLQNAPTATSSTYTVSRRHPSKRVVKRSKNADHDSDPVIEDETHLAPPEEFAGSDSKGAFWAELEPRYSKTLGVSLPEFMLSRSEHEIAFDDSVAG